MDRTVRFNYDELNINTLFKALKEYKKEAQRRNSTFLLGEEYLKELLSRYPNISKTRPPEEVGILTIRHKENGYKYKVVLKIFVERGERIIELTDAVTDNPSFKDVYSAPNMADNITAINFVTIADSLSTIGKR